jgi:hypothetical protein
VGGGGGHKMTKQQVTPDTESVKRATYGELPLSKDPDTNSGSNDNGAYNNTSRRKVGPRRFLFWGIGW